MSRYLIDTHVFVWLLIAPLRLGREIATRLADSANAAYVSAASAVELYDKHSKGRPTGLEPVLVQGGFAAAAEGAGLMKLDVTIEHAAAMRNLPLVHRDPFDRLLIAQALCENLTLVSHDAALSRYPRLKLLKV